MAQSRYFGFRKERRQGRTETLRNSIQILHGDVPCASLQVAVVGAIDADTVAEGFLAETRSFTSGTYRPSKPDQNVVCAHGADARGQR